MTSHALRVLSLLAAVSAACAWTAGLHAAPSGFAAGSIESVKRLTPEQRHERRVLQDAAAHQRFAGDAAKLVLARSGNAAARELALQMQKQQKKSQDGLTHLLHVRGMARPMLANEHVKVLKQLGKAGGRKFDRLFLEEVGLRAQTMELRSLERMGQVTHDPQLKAWIDAELPALRYQLSLAERALDHPAKQAPRGPRPGGERLARGVTGPGSR